MLRALEDHTTCAACLHVRTRWNYKVANKCELVDTACQVHGGIIIQRFEFSTIVFCGVNCMWCSLYIYVMGVPVATCMYLLQHNYIYNTLHKPLLFSSYVSSYQLNKYNAPPKKNVQSRSISSHVEKDHINVGFILLCGPRANYC